MLDQSQVLGLIKIKGPVVPMQIAKEIKRDSLMTSAILSQLVDTKKLKISKLKVGGSPLYYLEGQEQRLQSYVKHLDEKDRKTVEILREKAILQDDKQTPLMRFSLRTIKDFAVPLYVTIPNQKLLFWKWYLLPNKEAESMIKDVLGLNKPQPEPIQELPEKKLEPIKKEIDIPKVKQEIKKKTTPKEISTDFLKSIKSFFDEGNIVITNTTKIKKSEFDFEIQISTPLGKLPYYCKAIGKARINEKDISEAYVQSQLKKLPGILLITGKPTKKALEMISQFKGIIIKQL